MRRSIALLLLAAAWFAAAAPAGPSYTLTLTRGSRLMIDARSTGIQSGAARLRSRSDAAGSPFRTDPET